MTIPISILSGVRSEAMSARAQMPLPRPSEPCCQAHGAGGARAGQTHGTEPTWESAVLDEINRSLTLAAIGVQFEFDREAHVMIAKVVDVETGKLIRQMPSEEVMQLSKALGKLHDLLVHQAICRKAQATDNSQAPAPARWSSPWKTTAVRAPDPGAFTSVKV
jgi:flagellar protein FlaG